ncbi:unnamed protein product [Durusdinium trenchii]|uniref:Gustatory receptor n=2 Tax=Durusdinium trenchii TaxID=1381693 RepID=A0ABP0KAL6_9DINO
MFGLMDAHGCSSKLRRSVPFHLCEGSTWVMMLDAKSREMAGRSFMQPSTQVSEVTDTRMEAILLKIEETHRQHQQTLLQVLSTVQNLSATGVPSRHSVPRMSDPIGTIKSPERHSVRKKSGPTSSPSQTPGRVPSFFEMQSAVLRELGALYDSSQAGDAGRSGQSASFHTTCSFDEGGASIVPVPRPRTFLQEDGPQESLPGMIREDRHLSLPRPNRGSHMGSISKTAQAQILESHSNLSPVVDEVDRTRSVRMMADHPVLLHLLIGIPALCDVASAIILGWKYPNLSFNGFTVATLLIYSVLATFCVFMLGNALRSSDLHLATTRLHIFVSDFKIRWSEVSGQEWRKYLAAWCSMLLLFVATQALETNFVNHTANGDDMLFWATLNQAISVVSFSISSAVIFLSAYVQSHLLLGLDKSLDCWCCQIVNHMNFPVGVESWNAMQALLKCVGRELAGSFVALQGLASIGFMYFLVSGVTMAFRAEFQFMPFFIECLSSLPLPFLFLLGMRVCAHGADLTEKCRAMPAFVNQIPTNVLIDVERQYLVRFIADSSPGFTVRDVKLTREVFFKQVYIFVGLVSGLISVLSRLYM